MFGLGFQEIVVIAVIILVLFGAKKLPQIGEGLGKTVREIRSIKGEKKADKGKREEKKEDGFLSDLRKEADEIPGVKEARAIKQTADKVRNITKILR